MPMDNAHSICIGDRRIGPDHAPYIIAEMSGNHNQSLERALEIVRAAATAGAHAVKLQTYTADTMTLDCREPGFVIQDPNSLWDGRQLYELYDEAHTPWDWHRPIMDEATRLGIHCFSSPFDTTAVDFLEDLGVNAYKIASFELVDLPLIRHVAQTGKPMIMSTGMASLAEIDDAVRTARDAGCHDIVLLKCTSTYPATPENTNVLTVPALHQAFDCAVGLSDHTMGVGAAIAAVAHGACLVEKHFTLSRDDGGVDSAFSLEPDELALLVIETERAWQSLGEVRFGPGASEAGSLVFRRSLYITEDMQPGDLLTHENLRAIRPGHGLSPKYLDALLGKPVGRALTRGTPAQWSILTSDDD